MKTTKELLKKLSIENFRQIAEDEYTLNILTEKFKITDEIRNNPEKLYELYIKFIIFLIYNSEYFIAYESDLYDTIEKCAVFALSYDEDAIKYAIMDGEREWGFLTTCVTLENTDPDKYVTDAIDAWREKYGIDVEDHEYAMEESLYNDDDCMADIINTIHDNAYDVLNCKDDMGTKTHHLFYSAEDAIKHKFYLEDIIGRDELELPDEWLAVFKNNKLKH